MLTYLLHISDLHLVVDPQWNNMKNAILYSVRKTLKNVSRGHKLLVITGDFHNFVQNNYDQAIQFLLQLFDAMDIEPDKDVFVVPGNHDVSNKKTGSDRPLYIQAIKSKPEMLQSGMDKLLGYYDDYIKFVKTINIYPENCDSLPVTVHVRTWRNKINILHLNTVLIADGSIKNEQITDTTAATSDDIRKQLRYENLPCIVIGHNSFFDLMASQQTILSAMFFQENISAYLCGDRHVKNVNRAETRIVLRNKISSVAIPNIVSYRSSTDENDTYSDFGMIWQLWDEDTNHVSLEFFKWDPQDQAELQPDGKDEYDLRKLDQAVVSTQNINLSNSCWLSNDILTEKSLYTVRDSHVRNFLLGSHCKWNLAFSDRIVTRDIVNVLYNYAIEGGIFALVGPGGEGKSTILMQMCAKLILSGITVFYYRGYGEMEFPQNVSKHDIFVIDNPPDRKGFKNFLDKMIESEQTLILGARQNEWNLLKKSLRISDRDVIDIPIKIMTPKEAWNFADCVSNNLRCSRAKKEIKEIFQYNAYGFLYAAMLLVVNNKNSLEEIAHQIIENLNKKFPIVVLLLAHIVLSEHYGVKFAHYQLKYICNEMKLSSKDATQALSREVSANGDKYQTRHEVISALFYDELFSDNGLLSLDQIDSIFICLFKYHIENYENTYGKLKETAWDSILRLSGGISQTSLDAQKYIIDRLLDEFNTKPPKYFYLLPSYLANEDVLLLFYYKCYTREVILDAFLLQWCRLLQKNGASWMISEPFSPAWILRDSCIKHNAGSDAWLAWAQMEAEQNQVGDYESENTARWIFREACIKRNAGSDTWLAWAQMEVKQDQVGDYESENTARWIFREACIKGNAGSAAWLAWAQMEAKQDQVGDYESENTARWIFREACIKHNAGSNTWLAWAQMETEQDQIGDCESENTARWIYCKAIKRFPNVGPVFSSYARLELQHHSVQQARDILRKAIQYNDFCIGHLAILEFFCGNINSGDIYCSNQLMLRMEKEKQNSFTALRYLYHCSILLGQKENIERYHQELLEIPEYDPSNTTIEKFIQLCQEALI